MRVWVYCVCFLTMLVSAQAEQKVALVIGNGAYAKVVPLTNPPNDSALVAKAFESAGFAVTRLNDVSKAGMERALHDFSRKASDADIAAIYFAGHGIEAWGTNYLIPVDAELRTAVDLKFEATTLNLLLDAVSPAKKLKLVILDACRNNPFAGTQASDARGGGRGLARVEPEGGNTLVAYAAKDGTTAEDGAGRNSPFAVALAKYIKMPGLEVRALFGKVRDDVLATTNNRQQPYVYGSIGGDLLYLQSPPTGGTPEIAFWNRVKDSNDIEALQSYLDMYSTGVFAAVAKSKIASLRKSDAEVAAQNRVFAQPVWQAIQMARKSEKIAREKAAVARASLPEIKRIVAEANRAVREAEKKTPGYGVEEGDNYDVHWRCMGQMSPDGKHTGYGRCVFGNGQTFEGLFRDANFVKGHILYASRDQYDGEVMDGHPEGYGVSTYTDGRQLAGELRGNPRSGFAVMSVPLTTDKNDKTVLREMLGQRNDGALDGFGVFYLRNGIAVIGTFKDGHMTGVGAILNPDGTPVQQGYFENETLQTAMSPESVSR